MGRHRHREHLQPRLGGRPPARYRRLRTGPLALFRIGSHVTRGHGPRHSARSEPPGRVPRLDARHPQYRRPRRSHAKDRYSRRDALRRVHRPARRKPDHALQHRAGRSAAHQRSLHAGSGADDRLLRDRFRRHAQHDRKRAYDRGLPADAGHRLRGHALPRVEVRGGVCALLGRRLRCFPAPAARRSSARLLRGDSSRGER